MPTKPHPRLMERLSGQFEMIELEQADAGLIPDAQKAKILAIALFGHLPNALIDACPNLQIISCFGVGYDGIDATFAAQKNVMVCNTPDVVSDEVADTTIALLLNTLRELPKAENFLREGRWLKGSFPLSKLTLRNRHVGIYGLGRIGLEIARRLEGFGVKISYHSRTEKPGMTYPYCSTLLDLARSCDTLICIVPGGAATENAVNAAIFDALGPDGVFINLGRGSTVDEDALITALEQKTIAAAGLDVFKQEPDLDRRLLDLDNLCLLPHVGSASEHTRNAMADLQADNLINWFSGKPVLSPVPETIHLKQSFL